ncbi:MAG: M28 family peptidase, partial [archaeon]|nr:M28 family peptidase [archaeon]
TDNERTLFGGWSNTPYDPCYHQECDTYDNIDWKLALENAQAAAFVSGTLVSHPNLPRFLSTNDYDSIIAHRTSRAFLNSHYTCSKKHDIEFA